VSPEGQDLAAVRIHDEWATGLGGFVGRFESVLRTRRPTLMNACSEAVGGITHNLTPNFGNTTIIAP